MSKRSPALSRLAFGLVALLALGAGCVSDDGASGTAGEDPDAVDQMDADHERESVDGAGSGSAGDASAAGADQAAT